MVNGGTWYTPFASCEHRRDECANDPTWYPRVGGCWGSTEMDRGQVGADDRCAMYHANGKPVQGAGYLPREQARYSQGPNAGWSHTHRHTGRAPNQQQIWMMDSTGIVSQSDPGLACLVAPAFTSALNSRTPSWSICRM